MMAHFPTSMNGGPNLWAITSEERSKHDKQFNSLKPIGGFITGDQARTFFLQSGLPPTVLAEIWALADVNKDGKMDQQEFSIAMKLIKLKLQGLQLPTVLPPVMKQPPVPSPLMSARFGMGSMPNLSMLPTMPVIAPLAPTSSLTSVTSLAPLGLSTTLMPSFRTSSLSNGTTSLLQPLAAPSSATLPLPASLSQTSLGFGGTGMQKAQSLIDLGSSSSNSSSSTSLTGSSPKTGPSEWAVPQSSRLKYRQQFNTLDKSMSGYLSGPQVRNVLLQSNLTQTQLATIWNLADVDRDGKLRGDEFVLAMHLTDMAKSGQPLPLVLPPELIPPSFRGGKGDDPINGTLPFYQGIDEEKEPQKKIPATFEDKRKQNYERGNMELEKRRQTLLEQQQREAERLAQKARVEQERRERELQEQERKKQLELERRLEKQRELERQREEERRKEIERREAAKQELERQRRLEWERIRRQELLNQRNREQEDISKLKAKKKSLELELEAVGDKQQQIAGRLLEVRRRKQTQKSELDVINQKRDLGMMEINNLQLQLQEYQSKLSQLVPEKQALNERIKQVQPISGQDTELAKSSSEKLKLCQKLREQLDALEKETAAKLSEMDAFSNQLKELRQSYTKQQHTLKQLYKIKEDTIREVERKKAEELALKKKEEEEAVRRAKQEKENLWKEKVKKEEEERHKRLQEEQQMQEKIREEKQKAEEAAAARQRIIEAQQQRLAEEKRQREAEEKCQREEDERRKQAQILREAEERQRREEEDKRKQEQIKREIEERRQQQEEEQKRQDDAAASRQESEKRHSKIQLEEKFSVMLKQSVGKNSPRTPQEGSKNVTSGFRKSAAFVMFKALYSFEARNEEELGFHAGDSIQVDEGTVGEPGWLYGSLQGKTGWFPTSYVEKVPESEALSPLSPKKALLPPTLSQLTTSHASRPISPSAKTDDTDYSHQPFSNLSGNIARQKSAFTPTVPPMCFSPVHGQGQVVENLKAQALCSWTAKKDNHLNFSKEDIINVLEQQENWWFGEVHGKKGWFPKSYVKVLPGNDSKPAESEPVYATVNKKSSSVFQPIGEEYVALYTYESSEPGDLKFNEGDIILVTQREGEWWTGSTDGRTGFFPSNYVKPKEQDGVPRVQSTEPVLGGFSNAGKTGTLNQKPEIAQVTTVYAATGSEQLSLAPGQLILILKKNPSGWWQGELQARGKKRQKGWFPATHVKLLGPSSGKSTPAPAPVCQVIAMYDYTAANEDELTFAKGQFINVLNKDEPDWWQGEINGVSGLFPSNYVKMTTDCDPSQQWPQC